MYKDMIYKLETYKANIIQDFVKRSIYPNNEQIQAALSHIDLMLSYFKTVPGVSGHYFNTDDYNGMMTAIYSDFKLLYRLLKELTEDEYTKLKSYADTHLLELENKTDFYLSKSKEETATTSLGHTLLFKKSPFIIAQRDNHLYIDLGLLNLSKGSKIYTLINGHNLNMFQTILRFSLGVQNYYVSPYNTNTDYFTVPGTLNKKQYAYTLDNIKHDKMIKFNHKVLADASYQILAGKNLISYKTQEGTLFQTGTKDAPYRNEAVSFTETTLIDFYTYNAQSITFRFSNTPLRANFTIQNTAIKDLDIIHHFFIEMPANSAFEFFLNGGEVYAEKQKGLINETILYYPRSTNLKDFLVIETDANEKEKYNLTCEIIGVNKEDLSIDSFLVKESI